MPLSIPPLATLSLFKLLCTPCISSVSHLLSYFLTLYTLILVSFTSSLRCPPPSLLIRAICWRGRQRELRMDKIVLYVECGKVLEPAVCTHAWKYGMYACICLTVCMHAVTCESDSICSPDFIRLLSVLTVCTSIFSQWWGFYNPPSFLACCHLHLSILLTPLYSSLLYFPLVAMIIYTFSFLLHPLSPVCCNAFE